jgi:hypothetical protein
MSRANGRRLQRSMSRARQSLNRPALPCDILHTIATDDERSAAETPYGVITHHLSPGAAAEIFGKWYAGTATAGRAIEIAIAHATRAVVIDRRDRRVLYDNGKPFAREG